MNALEIDEKKKARGFAGLLEAILIPLNDNEKFKEDYKDTDVRILINAPNINYTALIIVNKGKISVEGYLKNPKENLQKKVIGWDAYIQMDTMLFLAFAMKRLSFIGMAKKIITRKIKLKGLNKLYKLMKMMKLLN